MPVTVFEPTITVSERLQTHALGRATTAAGIGQYFIEGYMYIDAYTSYFRGRWLVELAPKSKN